jgi:hypothetical protein
MGASVLRWGDSSIVGGPSHYGDAANIVKPQCGDGATISE